MQQSQLLRPELAEQEAHACRIAARPRKAGNKTELDRIIGRHEHDREGRRRGLRRKRWRGGKCGDHVHLTLHKFGRQPRQSIVLIVGMAIFDRHIASLDIAELGQAFAECRGQVRSRRTDHEMTNHRHRRLLRVCGERPRCRSAEQRDELAPVHSITSSARTRIAVGTVMPIALAVLRLMTSSNLVGCWTGRSAGFAPLRIRAT